jgi:hypothetical protein
MNWKSDMMASYVRDRYIEFHDGDSEIPSCKSLSLSRVLVIDPA